MSILVENLYPTLTLIERRKFYNKALEEWKKVSYQLKKRYFPPGECFGVCVFDLDVYNHMKVEVRLQYEHEYRLLFEQRTAVHYLRAMVALDNFETN